MISLDRELRYCSHPHLQFLKTNMKTALFGLALLAGLPAVAQTNVTIVEDFKPSSENQPGQLYPQVNSQHYVRFQVAGLTNAQSLKVSLGLGGRGGTTLTKGENGIWTGTTEGP